MFLGQGLAVFSTFILTEGIVDTHQFHMVPSTLLSIMKSLAKDLIQENIPFYQVRGLKGCLWAAICLHFIMSEL